MSHKHIQIEIDNHKIGLVLFINDCIVFSNSFHQVPATSFPVNQWVLNGVNTLKANVSINPHWTEELNEQSFKIVLKQYEGTPDNLVETVISSLEWEYIPDTQFPVNLTQEFSLDIPYGNWGWYDADAFNEDTVPVDSLKQYITSLHTALVNKDYTALEPFLTTKSTELAHAFGIPLNERFDDQKTFFITELFSHPAWGLEPLNFENMIFQFHAQGRLVEVIDIKGKSLIQSAILDEGYNFSLPLFLCHKNDQWILCR
ncbi:MAG: hypothetical protein GX639_03830 [Fibrobacter sp.]|nr:hypothetical protein [Fibrobacter sp.]